MDNYILTYRYISQKKTIEGAKIQEQFDTELFDIPTNPILIKSLINKDKIYDLAKKVKNSENLKNWYSQQIKPELPKNIKILLCQRINSSWEYDLRRRFVSFLIITTVLYYAFFLTVFIVRNTGFFDILLLVMPSLSFLIFGVKHSSTLLSQVNSKNELLTTIDNLLDNYKKKNEIPETEKLRQIQDLIYSQRTISEKIPDWFYNLFRKYNENKTDTIIKEINLKL